MAVSLTGINGFIYSVFYFVLIDDEKMPMKKLILFFLLAGVALGAHAARSLPKKAKPVVSGGIRYSAPRHQDEWEQKGGYVEATDVKSGKRLWILKVYQV